MYLIVSLGVFAFLLALLVTPIARDLFRRIDLVDRPDRLRKFHPSPIPRVGGVVIVLSYILAFAIALLLPFSFKTTIEQALPRFWNLLPAAELIFVTGLIDDIIGLRPWQKLLGQTAAAYIACTSGVRIESIADYPLDPWVSMIVSIVWLLICTNSFNLIDGMDGLATGVGLFASTTVFIAALTHNSLDLALVTIPLMGCLLGFLRYNFNPASVFLGDSGSLLIGFMLGCFGALWSQKSATLLGMTAPLMAVAIPLLDASLAVFRRFLRNQPIFQADRGHIHHRLLDLGLTPRRSALLMYGVCGLVASLSLLQDVFDNRFGGLIIVLFCVATWIGVQHLGYVEFGLARQMFMKGNFRRIIDAQTQLKHFENALLKAATLEEVFTCIGQNVERFGFESFDIKIGDEFRRSAVTTETLWQVRIPIGSGDYINLHRRFTAELETVPIGSLANAIQTAVENRVAHFQLRGTPAQASQTYARATAGGV